MCTRKPDRLRTHQGHVFDEGQVSVDKSCQFGQALHHRLDQYHPDLDLLLRSLQRIQAANRLGECVCTLDDVVMEAVMVPVKRNAPCQGWMQPFKHVGWNAVAEGTPVRENMQMSVGEHLGAVGHNSSEILPEQRGLSACYRQ